MSSEHPRGGHGNSEWVGSVPMSHTGQRGRRGCQGTGPRSQRPRTQQIQILARGVWCEPREFGSKIGLKRLCASGSLHERLCLP